MAETLGDSPADKAQKKTSGRILRTEVSEGMAALELPLARLALSGFSAGMDLGFSLFLVAILRSLTQDVLPAPLGDLISAAAYPFGFVVVVLGRSELFTEQTSLAVLPLLARETTLRRVARLWVVVFISNVAGAAAFAAIAAPLGSASGVVRPEVYGHISEGIVRQEWWLLFWSGVLAGWLMGLLSWLVAAGRDTTSQILIVWMIGMTLGLGRLHHSVLGSVEVLAGVFWGPSSLGDFGRFLLWSALGNAVGGPVFVALIKFGHAHGKETESG